MTISISFIIPTFNRSSNIKREIETYIQVLRNIQNLSFEIILVNDCSVDNTSFLIAELAELFTEITTVNLIKNEGPGIARNYGLKIAKNDFIWFLDDDDQLDQHGTQMIINLIKRDQLVESKIYAHSLLKTYSKPWQNKLKIKEVLKNVILFREKQEVFNYIFNRKFLLNKNIRFTSGVHEDISFVVEVLSNLEDIEILDFDVYIKVIREDSITFRMNQSRVDGYINSYRNILALGDQYSYFNYIDMSEFKAQIFGVVCYLIVRNSDESGVTLLSYFIGGLQASKLDRSLPSEFNEYNSNFKFAVSELARGIHKKLSIEIIYSKLVSIFNSYLSCKDLQNSIFLGPNEIRACCKRFFVDGKQKGDVVLLLAKEDINLAKINVAKRELINEINREESAVCSGCPYIERVSSNFEDSNINYLSLENFSYCNMRCTYCSPKYYDGTEAKYNAVNIISQLVSANKLSKNCHSVWGGGEPTISPTFGAITELLLQNIDSGKIRVLSNSLKFSEKLSLYLADSRVHLVTSIDAGTQEKFVEIRGRGKIDSVLKNLSQYSGATEDKSRVTLKYIFTSENFSSYELESLTDKLQSYNLFDSLFQISCDFRVENPGLEVICGFYELASRLHSKGVKYVFFDDLIRDRLDISNELADNVLEYLNKRNLYTERIYSYRNSEKVILWGRGLQSSWYMDSTSYGKAGNILSQISSYADLQGLDFHATKIVPSGIQSIYEIIKNIESSPVNKSLICPVFL